MIRAALLAVASLFSFVVSAQTAPPPVQAFFEDLAFTAARISPSGRHVAMGITPKGGRTQLVVLDTATMKATVAVAPKDVDVLRFDWVNDDRIVFNVRTTDLAQADMRQSPGLYAVQRDGSEYRQLADRMQPWVRERSTGPRLMDFTTRFHSTTRNRDSDDIFVVSTEFGVDNHWQTNVLHRLNTRTGRSTPVLRPGDTSNWLVDASDEPRIAVTHEKSRSALRYRDPKDGAWRVLSEFDRFVEGGITPIGFGPDNALYVAARNGKDKRALYRYDLARNALDAEPLLSMRDFDFDNDLYAHEPDFDGMLIFGKGSLRGVRYVSDARSTAWFDPKANELQQKVDKLLPGTANEIDLPYNAQVPVALVKSFSDTNPGTYLLYHTETGKLTVIGTAMRDIEPRHMAQRDLVRYKARDGLEIPAWLTLPKGGKGKKHPLVVLVHGGPWVRGGEWKWEADSQFLASRGYAVLEPEFRGSLGYGHRHFRSSFKQWGLAMQNDVADGAKWAVQQGIADTNRICIAGASYGGYATLMGLVNDPELFRCGMAWVGVTDIELLYTATWSDFSWVYKQYGMPRLVGDREADAAQLKATSPIQQAARIKQPLMLAYGGADRRVPIEHGTRFRDAVTKSNANVEWIEYTEEGHGWYLVKNRVDFWSRVEKFLEKNIGR
ncbi:MAG: S9 family peptidase [Burkholderiales bacterium]|nr:S9 family peptidase [Burkholderiales bacterium]